jgi:hypothetical protein
MDLDIPIRYRNLTWLSGLLLVVALLGISWFYSPFRSALNNNQGVISAGLTLMLVILYLGQYHLQSRQLEFQNKPLVEIQQYDTDGKEIEIWLSNLGNGVATDIELKSCLDFEATDEFEGVCGYRRLRRVGENGDPKRRVGNSLKPGEHNVRFV